MHFTMFINYFCLLHISTYVYPPPKCSFLCHNLRLCSCSPFLTVLSFLLPLRLGWGVEIDGCDDGIDDGCSDTLCLMLLGIDDGCSEVDGLVLDSTIDVSDVGHGPSAYLRHDIGSLLLS